MSRVDHRRAVPEARRLVVKIGSSSLTDPSGGVITQVDVGTENVSTAGTIDLGHFIFTLP